MVNNKTFNVLVSDIGKDIIPSLILLFDEEVRRRLECLNSTKSTITEKACAAHTIKGTTASLGATEMSATAEFLEKALRDGDEERSYKYTKYINKIFPDTLHELKRLTEQID